MQLLHIEKDEYKQYIFKGIKNGMLAFLISYLTLTAMSLALNLTVVKHLITVLQGSIGNELQFSLANVAKVTNILINYSVFNSIHGFKIGMLIMALIPLLAFYIADRKDNVKEGLNIPNSIIIFVASVVYAGLVVLVSFVSRSELAGVSLDFVSVGNFLNTLLVVFVLQLQIALYYHKDAHVIIKSTRITIRTMALAGLIITVVSMFSVLKIFKVSLLAKIGGALGALPNLIVYETLKNLGIKMSLSESLMKWMDTLHVDINAAPLYSRIFISIILVMVAGYCISKFEKEQYFLCTLGYGTMVSGIIAFLAYCATSNMEKVIFVGNIKFGINVVESFYMTFIYIFASSILYYLINLIKTTLKE